MVAAEALQPFVRELKVREDLDEVPLNVLILVGLRDMKRFDRRRFLSSDSQNPG